MRAGPFVRVVAVVQGILACVCATVLGGCIAGPPGPRGPLHGQGIELGADMGFAVSHARTGKPPNAHRGTSDHYHSPLTILPQHAELRLAPVDFVDLGMDLSWLDGGLDLRIGRPAARNRFWVGHVAAGARSGEFNLFKDTKRTRSLWARLEAYPLVAGDTGRLLLAAGLNVGRFYHQVEVPDRSDNFEGFGPSASHIVRAETRLETSVGYAFERGPSPLLVAVNPYFVLRSRALPERCRLCPWPAWKQTWGVVVLVRAGLRPRLRSKPE